MKRLYHSAILDHLYENRQMLFLMGPRQVGKTTTCFSLEQDFAQFFYFTWDDFKDIEKILDGPKAIAQAIGLEALFESKPIIVFDEIHKFSAWKDFLKGFYDLYSERIHIVVTGSARLDIYKKGGDSLMGRYFLYHFHPLSVAELAYAEFPQQEIRPFPFEIEKDRFNALWEFGGYPDPFLKANRRFFNR